MRDASKTPCLVVKILVLSFRSPLSTIPPGDSELGICTWPLPLWHSWLTGYWPLWGLPFSSVSHTTLCRNFSPNTRSLSQWKLHPNWSNIMKHWKNPNISSFKQHTRVLKTMDPWPVPISKVPLLCPGCLSTKGSFILIWTHSLKRSWIFLDQSSIFILREA